MHTGLFAWVILIHWLVSLFLLIVFLVSNMIMGTVGAVIPVQVAYFQAVIFKEHPRNCLLSFLNTGVLTLSETLCHLTSRPVPPRLATRAAVVGLLPFAYQDKRFIL